MTVLALFGVVLALCGVGALISRVVLFWGD